MHTFLINELHGVAAYLFEVPNSVRGALYNYWLNFKLYTGGLAVSTHPHDFDLLKRTTQITRSRMRHFLIQLFDF